jgi:hypothetical protein
MTDTSDKALLALAERLEGTPLYEGHGEASDFPEAVAAALRAIVAERQPQPTGDVIETLARALLEPRTGTAKDIATALLAQIAPTLRAEGMEMAAGQFAKWLDASAWQVTEGPHSWKNNVCEHGNHGYAGCEACMEEGLSRQISDLLADAKRLREGGEG